MADCVPSKAITHHYNKIGFLWFPLW